MTTRHLIALAGILAAALCLTVGCARPVLEASPVTYPIGEHTRIDASFVEHRARNYAAKAAQERGIDPVGWKVDGVGKSEAEGGWYADLSRETSKGEPDPARLRVRIEVLDGEIRATGTWAKPR